MTTKSNMASGAADPSDADAARAPAGAEAQPVAVIPGPKPVVTGAQDVASKAQETPAPESGPTRARQATEEATEKTTEKPAEKPAEKIAEKIQEKTDPKSANTALDMRPGAVARREAKKQAAREAKADTQPKPGQKPGQKNPGQNPANRPNQNQNQNQNRWPGPPQGGQKGGAGQAKAAPARVIEIQPLAQPAGMRKRHWGLIFSFIAMVLAPLGALVFYLWFIAVDQYASTAGFTVRQEEGASANDLLGGLAQFAGTGTGTDSDILYEFIQSQEIIEAIDNRMDLRGHYSANWPEDWMFSLWKDATLEDMIWFWQRVVRISYDQSSGLTEVRVLAFDPDYAQQIAEQIVVKSQQMINALNTQAREDAMRYARFDLDEAVERLKVAREALTQFRTRTRIVDPAADIQGRMGVMANLQQQLAEALIEHDLLTDTASSSDPRVKNARRLIDVIRQRIALERETFTSDSTETGAVGEDYPSLIAEFERLSVDREFAEETYRAALLSLGVARANAARQSRYLAAYIPPTLSQTSEFPQRFILIGLAALFVGMIWSILMLVFYSLRDRR